MYQLLLRNEFIKFLLNVSRNTATSESQKVLQDLESLVRQIPRNKTDLFNYKINWTLLATVSFIFFKNQLIF